MDIELVKRFAALYTGYELAYGQFKSKNKRDDRGKLLGRSWTERKPVTLDLYKQHLEGQGPSLGIALLDREEMCHFGVIDLDIYPLPDTLVVERKVASLGLPLTVIHSKSNGAHLTVFIKEGVPATTLLRKLEDWSALLGYSGSTEKFPKTTQRVDENVDIGSWVNLPYYDAANTERWAAFEGKQISLEEFLDLAESRRVNRSDLEDLTYKGGSETDKYFEGPPCLQHLFAQGGFVEGTKREGMFDVGVYLRKRYQDSWEDKLTAYNAIMCDPPLRNDEIAVITKSLKKKDYGYKCKAPPIAEHCQRRLCLSRKFGVGDDGPQSQGLEISAITAYMVEDTDDPPMWGMEIGGRRILIDNATFYERDAFNKACLATIRRVPIHVPPSRWARIVDELAANAEVIYTPKEVSATGNLWEWVTAYMLGAKAQSMDQVAVSGAFIEDGFVYFRAWDLLSFLDNRRVKYKGAQAVHQLLTKHGGGSKFHNFKKGGYNVWKVPLPEGHRGAVDLVPTDSEQKEPF